MHTVTPKTEKGIVLLEAIIAVAVMMTMFAATMALLTSSVQGIRISSDQLTATYLAQDAMEQLIAKNQYEYNTFKDWLNRVGTCTAASGCAMDFFTNQLNTMPVRCTNVNVNGCQLYYDSVEKIYTTIDNGSDSEPSRFTRKLFIDHTAGDHQAYVTVVVSWPDGANTMQYELHHILYDYTPANDF